MMMSQRRQQLELLALQRELLVARADFQRAALCARWRDSLKPVKALTRLLPIGPSWPGTLFGIVVPLLARFVAKKHIVGRLTKWALPTWLAARWIRRIMHR